MRRLLLALLLCGCGKPMMMPLPDAGSDAGHDAGADTCLDADAGPPFDAGGLDAGDFSCLGEPLPLTAVARLDVDGFVTAAGISRKPVDDALIELFDQAGARLATDVSHDGGWYAVHAAIGCAPLAGSMRASNPDAGFYDVRYYPPAPWRRSRSALELVIFDQAAESLVSAIANVHIDAGTAALAVGIDDCLGLSLPGATITTSTPGDVRYVADNGLPSQMLSATSTKGQALVFNLAPGPVTIGATVSGKTLPSKTVTLRPDAVTAVTIEP